MAMMYMIKMATKSVMYRILIGELMIPIIGNSLRNYIPGLMPVPATILITKMFIITTGTISTLLTHATSRRYVNALSTDALWIFTWE
jgi:uncharacterized membrane protein (GlpM family)